MRIIPLTVQPPRRRVPRRAQRYPVRWAVSEINGQPAQDAWVVDVSCMGARLETTLALSPNMSITFTVSFPDEMTELMLTGRVIWMRPIFSNLGRYHQGVQFYGVNWDLDRLGKMDSSKSR
jgi:hypothetical protein